MLSGRFLSYLKKRKISRNGHSLSFVVPLVVTRCHSLSLVVPLVVTRCHSLSLVVPLVVTRCTTRCHSLYHSLSFVVTRCHSLSLVVLLVVTLYTTRCHSLSLDVLLVCLFINDRKKTILQTKFVIIILYSYYRRRTIEKRFYYDLNKVKWGRVKRWSNVENFCFL